MESSIVLDSTDYAQLSTLDVGGRVKFIRELLQKRFGNKYSGKSVASRVGISQPNLVHMERNANDVPSKVLRAISRDFNVKMDIFFDDFYIGEYKSIVIEHQQIQDDNELGVAGENYISNANAKGVNPITENSYKFVVIAFLEATNGDKREIFTSRSKEVYTRPHVRHVIANLINTIDETDILINPNHLPSEHRTSSSVQALQHIEAKDNPELYIWYPKKLYNDTMQFLYNVGRKYTSDLNEKTTTNQED